MTDHIQNFSLSNFLEILFKKIGSFSELDDSLINPEIEEYLATEADKDKFEDLLNHFDQDKHISSSRSFSAKFSNGETLSIK